MIGCIIQARMASTRLPGKIMKTIKKRPIIDYVITQLQFSKNIEKGFNFYINNFFDENIPKYYHNKRYPIDIHCPAELLLVIAKLKKYGKYSELSKKILTWTINNMQDEKGYFYYQLKPIISSKISYMRWSNAFMFNAFTFFLKDRLYD